MLMVGCLPVPFPKSNIICATDSQMKEYTIYNASVAHWYTSSHMLEGAVDTDTTCQAETGVPLINPI